MVRSRRGSRGRNCLYPYFMDTDYRRLTLAFAAATAGTAYAYTGLSNFVPPSYPPLEPHPPITAGPPDSLGAAIMTVAIGGVVAAWGVREVWRALGPTAGAAEIT